MWQNARQHHEQDSADEREDRLNKFRQTAEQTRVAAGEVTEDGEHRLFNNSL